MKATKISAWLLLGLSSLWMVAFGLPKALALPSPMVQVMVDMHYSMGFTRFIGACEVLGGIGLLIPRTRFWAALALLPIFPGAIGSHWGAGEAAASAIAPAIAFFLILSALLMDRWLDNRKKSLQPA